MLRRSDPLADPRPRGRHAVPALVAVSLALALGVAALLLAGAQRGRERDVDEQLAQQAKVGAAMIAGLRESTMASWSLQYARRLGTGEVSRARLDRVARRAGGLFVDVVDPDGRVLATSSRSPSTVGLGIGDPNFRIGRVGSDPSVTIAAPVGPRTLVIGLPRAGLTELLTSALIRLPSPWPADMYAVDDRGRVISEWGTGGRTAEVVRLGADGIDRAARSPLRAGPSAISAAPIAGTAWSFAVRAPRRVTDSGISGSAFVLPWVLLAAAGLGAVFVFVLVARSRRSAEALTREQERAVAVLTVLRDGYLFVRDGRVVDVNDRLCELAGLRREELLGAGEDHPVVRALALTADDEPEAHTVLVRADGHRVDVAVTNHRTPASGRHEPGRVSVVRDIGSQKRTERRLSRLASTDALTGLANRGAFDMALSVQVERARRERLPLSLVVLDVDRFKAVNDVFGHPVGDRVLAEVARRLRDVVRDDDLLARIGGEEFACVLPGLGPHEALEIAERARAAIGEHPFAVVGELTISAGVCTLGDHDAADLYAAADTALLRAKRAGRDRTVGAAPADPAGAGATHPRAAALAGSDRSR